MSLQAQRNAINAKVASPNRAMVPRRPAILRAPTTMATTTNSPPADSCGECRRKKGGKRK